MQGLLGTTPALPVRWRARAPRIEDNVARLAHDRLQECGNRLFIGQATQDILQEAWQRVKSNKGAAGVDEVAIDEIREYGEARFLSEIEQELRNGSYRVSLVRRVHIEKPGQPGKTRPLGIPTVKDRVVQMAVKLVIEPLFEADFVPCSFGFRPEKTPRMALSIIAEKTQAGYSHVVDVDLKSYFDVSAG